MKNFSTNQMSKAMYYITHTQFRKESWKVISKSGLEWASVPHSDNGTFLKNNVNKAYDRLNLFHKCVGANFLNTILI